jgi:hypothetical protein
VAEPDVSAFQYPKLSSDEDSIRLLRLVFPKGKPESQEISCELGSFSLTQRPPYKTLSYTWGDPFPSDYDFNATFSQTADSSAENHTEKQIESKENWVTECHKILCNGAPVYVSLNLFELLRQLCSNIESGYLWIDRLCINQQDNLEKSSQVTLMSTTYSKAESVIIWLGRSDLNAKAALQIHDSFEFVYPLDDKTQDQHDPSADSFWSSFAVPEPNSLLWKGWDQFFPRNWHRRLWTLQETALSRTVDHVLCGELKFDWYLLQELSYYFARPKWAEYFRKRNLSYLGPRMKLEKRSYHEEIISRPSENRAALIAKYRSFSLGAIITETLCQSLKLRCSNPRDVVYGVLGILQNPRRHGPRLEFDINYDIHVVDLYLKITKLCLENSMDLGILSIVVHSPSTLSDGCPSWMPDFYELARTSQGF